MKIIYFKLILISALLTCFILACQKSDISVQNENKINSVEQRTCIPSNFYPVITSGSDLFKYRLAIALYRLYVDVYFYYPDTGPVTAVMVRQASNTGFPATMLSISAGNGIAPIISPYIIAHSANTNIVWQQETNFISQASNSLSTSIQQEIVNWSNAQDANTSLYGSYSIIFQITSSNGQNVYTGKGGGTIRCEQSSNSRCAQMPLRADYQKAVENFANIQGSKSSLESEAYKEEAIRMFVSGFNNSNPANDDLYNLINSPGKNYISIDGY